MPVRDLSLQRLQDLKDWLKQDTKQQRERVEQLAERLGDLPSLDVLQAISAQVARLRGVRVALAAFDHAEDLPFRPIPIQVHDEPTSYAVIASDGSQILPEAHDLVPIAYVQAGCAATARGVAEASALVSAIRQVVWSKWWVGNQLTDIESGDRLTPAQLNAQRDLAERQVLVEACRAVVQHNATPLALVDGTLLPFALLSSQTPDPAMLGEFIEAMNALQDCRAIVCGYVDAPDSALLVRTCALADLLPDQVSEQSVRARLAQTHAVKDREVLRLILPPRHRTPLFTPSWKINIPAALKQHQVRVCYINLARPGVSFPVIARLELPAWCAGAAQVNQLCAALMRQAEVGDARTRGYPFILRLVHAHVVIRQREAQAMKRVLTQLAHRSGAELVFSPKVRFKLRR